jgi:hypothetical protein
MRPTIECRFDMLDDVVLDVNNMFLPPQYENNWRGLIRPDNDLNYRTIGSMRLPQAPNVGEIFNLDGHPYAVHSLGWSSSNGKDNPELYCYITVIDVSPKDNPIRKKHNLPTTNEKKDSLKDLEMFQIYSRPIDDNLIVKTPTGEWCLSPTSACLVFGHDHNGYVKLTYEEALKITAFQKQLNWYHGICKKHDFDYANEYRSSPNALLSRRVYVSRNNHVILDYDHNRLLQLLPDGDRKLLLKKSCKDMQLKMTDVKTLFEEELLTNNVFEDNHTHNYNIACGIIGGDKWSRHLLTIDELLPYELYQVAGGDLYFIDKKDQMWLLKKGYYRAEKMNFRKGSLFKHIEYLDAISQDLLNNKTPKGLYNKAGSKSFYFKCCKKAETGPFNLKFDDLLRYNLYLAGDHKLYCIMRTGNRNKYIVFHRPDYATTFENPKGVSAISKEEMANLRFLEVSYEEAIKRGFLSNILTATGGEETCKEYFRRECKLAQVNCNREYDLDHMDLEDGKLYLANAIYGRTHFIKDGKVYLMDKTGFRVIWSKSQVEDYAFSEISLRDAFLQGFITEDTWGGMKDNLSFIKDAQSGEAENLRDLDKEINNKIGNLDNIPIEDIEESWGQLANGPMAEGIILKGNIKKNKTFVKVLPPKHALGTTIHQQLEKMKEENNTDKVIVDHPPTIQTGTDFHYPPNTKVEPPKISEALNLAKTYAERIKQLMDTYQYSYMEARWLLAQCHEPAHPAAKSLNGLLSSDELVEGKLYVIDASGFETVINPRPFCKPTENHVCFKRNGLNYLTRKSGIRHYVGYTQKVYKEISFEDAVEQKLLTDIDQQKLKFNINFDQIEPLKLYLAVDMLKDDLSDTFLCSKMLGEGNKHVITLDDTKRIASEEYRHYYFKEISLQDALKHGWLSTRRKSIEKGCASSFQLYIDACKRQNDIDNGFDIRQVDFEEEGLYITNTIEKPHSVHFRIGDKWTSLNKRDGDFRSYSIDKDVPVLFQEVTLFEAYALGVIDQAAVNYVRKHRTGKWDDQFNFPLTFSDLAPNKFYVCNELEIPSKAYINHSDRITTLSDISYGHFAPYVHDHGKNKRFREITYLEAKNLGILVEGKTNDRWVVKNMDVAPQKEPRWIPETLGTPFTKDQQAEIDTQKLEYEIMLASQKEEFEEAMEKNFEEAFGLLQEEKKKVADLENELYEEKEVIKSYSREINHLVETVDYGKELVEGLLRSRPSQVDIKIKKSPFYNRLDLDDHHKGTWVANRREFHYLYKSCDFSSGPCYIPVPVSDKNYHSVLDFKDHLRNNHPEAYYLGVFDTYQGDPRELATKLGVTIDGENEERQI